MEMTIERIIEIYNEPGRISGTLIRGNSEEDTKYNSETIEALQSINVILRKYQKIEKIVKNTQQLCSYGSAFIDIRGVVEDGND